MRESRERIALFDFCETLVSFQTADEFVRFVRETSGSRRMRLLDKAHTLLRKAHVISLLERLFPGRSVNKRIVLLGLAGFTGSEIDRYAGLYYERRLRPNLIQRSVDALVALRDDGWRIVLVSGGYEPYLKYFAREFGIAESDIIATRLKFRRGVCRGRFDGKDCMYGYKTVLLDRRFSRAATESVAFSDSKSDLPLLEWADRGVIVRRKEQDVKWGKGHGFTELIWDE